MEAIEASHPSTECCMCGDYGFSHELFLCNVCQFRSQHRYCSNLYPKAKSYGVCNWCLKQLEDATVDRAQNSSNSSSSGKNSGDDKENSKKIKGVKQPSEEVSPATRKRIITYGELEEKLRRTKSEDISNKKQVFRSKVRRYRLLDEVSSQ